MKGARLARRKIQPGVKDAVAALTIDAALPNKEVARRFGLDVQTVRRIQRDVRGLDPVAVAELRRALPDLLQLLASSHAVQALEKMDDPNASVRHTFGAKLAVEAGRVAQPGAEAPGHTVLTFINQLKIHAAAPPPEVIVDAVAIREPEPPGGGADLAGPDPDAVRGEAPAGGAGLPALWSGDSGDQPEAGVGEPLADDRGVPGGEAGG